MTTFTMDSTTPTPESRRQLGKQRLRDMNPSPGFLSAMTTCLQLKDSLDIGHPEFTYALLRVLRLVTIDLMDDFVEVVQELGLLPDADYYSEDWEPVYQLKDILGMVDVPIDILETSMAQYAAERAVQGLGSVGIDPARVHRKQ